MTDDAARGRRVGRAAVDVAKALGLFVAWQLVMSAFLFMHPAAAAVWLLALAWLGAWAYLLRGGVRRRWGAVVRAREPAPGSWRWVALAAPAMAAAALSAWVFLRALGLADEPPLPEVLREFAERPGGAAALAVLIVGAAPVWEEVIFRGWMQRPLERRLGPGWAIGITAVVFALAHLQADGLPIRLVGGAALGWAVWATRSLWVGVALHAAWNAGVLAFGGVFPDFDPGGGGVRLALPALAVFCGAALLFAVAGRGMWTARRERKAAKGAPAPPRDP